MLNFGHKLTNLPNKMTKSRRQKHRCMVAYQAFLHIFPIKLHPILLLVMIDRTCKNYKWIGPTCKCFTSVSCFMQIGPTATASAAGWARLRKAR